MAIIYTYPKLQDPQGNELIVVSDVNNKNATRLITIADIASLVPGGDGCGASIVNIVDSEGTPIYTPPACSPMILTSSDGSVGIAAIPGGINLTTSTSVDCATTNQIGGLKAYPTTIESGFWPEPVEEGTYYPIEVVDYPEAGQSATCYGAVKIPDAAAPNTTFSVTQGPSDPTDPFLTVNVNGTPQNVSIRGQLGVTVQRFNSSIIAIQSVCATETERGSVMVGRVNGELQLTLPDEGTPTAIEVNENCEAFVRIPSGGDPYVLPCAEPTVLGGIKATKVTTTVPTAATEGTYYPIQVLDQVDEQDECRAVVRIPDPETPATPGDGQIDIVAGTGLTGGGSFTVNQAGNSTITLNAESAANETGWSPMTITEGATTLNQQPENSLTIFYHAT